METRNWLEIKESIVFGYVFGYVFPLKPRLKVFALFGIISITLLLKVEIFQHVTVKVNSYELSFKSLSRPQTIF